MLRSTAAVQSTVWQPGTAGSSPGGLLRYENVFPIFSADQAATWTSTALVLSRRNETPSHIFCGFQVLCRPIIEQHDSQDGVQNYLCKSVLSLSISCLQTARRLSQKSLHDYHTLLALIPRLTEAHLVTVENALSLSRGAACDNLTLGTVGTKSISKESERE